jgi:hypothetical protein
MISFKGSHFPKDIILYAVFLRQVLTRAQSPLDHFRTLNITNGISIDTDYKFIYRKKQSCDLVQILKGLEPFHDYIEGISIESTWLVLAGGWIDNYSATQKSGLSSLE